MLGAMRRFIAYSWRSITTSTPALKLLPASLCLLALGHIVLISRLDKNIGKYQKQHKMKPLKLAKTTKRVLIYSTRLLTRCLTLNPLLKRIVVLSYRSVIKENLSLQNNKKIHRRYKRLNPRLKNKNNVHARVEGAQLSKE